MCFVGCRERERERDRQRETEQAEPFNFIKKEALAQVFSVNFAKFLSTPFLTEHLCWLLLLRCVKIENERLIALLVNM